MTTNRAHVLLWTDSPTAYLDAVKAAGLADRVVLDTLPRKDKPSADQLARTEALMAGGVPAGLLPSMPKLRWAQAMSAGVEGWMALPDLPQALTLTCARGTHTESMPENIMAALFYAAKPVRIAVENQKSAKWVNTVPQPLTGKTLGILGLGRIGARVCHYARAFDMKVIAWSQNMTADAAAAVGATRVEKDELMRASDVLSLHVVLSERTRGLLGERELALMKPTAYLVNTARAALVQEAALMDALRNKRIAGAALDVLHVEPLPDAHELRGMDNVVLTPHLGYTIEERLRLFHGKTVESIEAFVTGAPVRVVNPEVLGKRA